MHVCLFLEILFNPLHVPILQAGMKFIFSHNIGRSGKRFLLVKSYSRPQRGDFPLVYYTDTQWSAHWSRPWKWLQAFRPWKWLLCYLFPWFKSRYVYRAGNQSVCSIATMRQHHPVIPRESWRSLVHKISALFPIPVGHYLDTLTPASVNPSLSLSFIRILMFYVKNFLLGNKDTSSSREED